MKGFYIDGPEARITKTGFTKVKLEIYNGQTYENVEPIRLFPTSGMTRYISLVGEDGIEVAIIRDLEGLTPDSRKAVEACLSNYYVIPKIKRLISRTEKYGNIKWVVETNMGVHSFNIVNTSTDIKQLYDGRVLIRDSNDNRYEIENINAMDKATISLLKYDM